MAQGKYRVVYKDKDDGQAKVKELDTLSEVDQFTSATRASALVRYAVSLPKGDNVPFEVREEAEEYARKNNGQLTRRMPLRDLPSNVYALYWST